MKTCPIFKKLFCQGKFKEITIRIGHTQNEKPADQHILEMEMPRNGLEMKYERSKIIPI